MGLGLKRHYPACHLAPVLVATLCWLGAMAPSAARAVVHEKIQPPMRSSPAFSNVSGPSSVAVPAHRLSVAPMMDWTDRHCRYFHRLLSRHALLYTEMVTTGALVHGDVARHLRFNA